MDTDRGSQQSRDFRTLPHSATRLRGGLRDLEVASPDWWHEVSQIREKVADNPTERSMSRTSTHRSLASLTSPESASSRHDSAVRQQTIRSTMTSAASTSSFKNNPSTPAHLVSANRRYTTHGEESRLERPYTPQANTSPRSTSRPSYSRQANTSRSGQGSSIADDNEGHYSLLRDVGHYPPQFIGGSKFLSDLALFTGAIFFPRGTAGSAWYKWA